MGDVISLGLFRSGEFLGGLDLDQCAAVTHHTGPAEVRAGAGSGKTRCLTLRVAFLAKTHGVDPRRILAVTFTRKAADEMTGRIAALIGAGRTEATTFHALCRRILQREMGPAWRAWDTEIGQAAARYERMLKTACGRDHLQWTGSDVDLLRGFVELAKAEAAAPHSDRAIALAEARHAHYGVPGTRPDLTNRAYELAETWRVDAKLFTFADWMVRAAQILASDPDARARWANAWDFVMVDEAQDNSPVQAAIVFGLTLNHGNLMMIGDVKQNVYSFRGSIGIEFANFHATHGARRIDLATNYRSADAIVEAANLAALDATDGARDPPMRAFRGAPGRVTIDGFPDPDAEARAVVAEIVQARVDGATWSDCAVLYRVHAASRAVEDQLLRAGVPHRVVGGVPFYKRPEARALVAYLRMVDRTATTDDVLTSLKSPFRYVARAFLDAIEALFRDPPADFEVPPGVTPLRAVLLEAARRSRAHGRTVELVDQWATLITRCRADVAREEHPATPRELLETIVQATKFRDWLRTERGGDTTENDAGVVVDEVLRAAGAFATIGAFVAHVDASLAAAEAAQKAEGRVDEVLLMSVHSSKGREFNHVFVIRCNDGWMPHAKCIDELEERRIFYVAVTRARDTLRISYTLSGRDRPSPYLDRLRPLCDPLEARGGSEIEVLSW